MGKRNNKISLISTGFLTLGFILQGFLPHVALASTTSTGFNWGGGKTSILKDKVATLATETVKNIKIPLLLGVKVEDLDDTWGDARSNGRSHEGIDIMAPRGTFIVSPTDAVVARVDSRPIGGNVVFTVNPGGETFYYAHLDSVRTGLEVGDVLKAGDLIGYVGNTGNAKGTPTHLHFTIYNSASKAINPYPRLTTEFTLAEKADSLRKILAEASDKEKIIQNLSVKYADVMTLALTQPIEATLAIATSTDTSSNIQSNLGLIKVSEASDEEKQKFSLTRDLKEGAKGEDVSELQEFLINEKTGTAAVALAKTGATGFFGPMTTKALAEYQKQNGILPAKGYLGEKTREHLKSEGVLAVQYTN